uniref:Uncharacterized protein n=1 Tax=Trypanosoma congolense (strain IL3000) TaxID=1068625 RepID=G0UX56_TRYCI|nr:conserved hypothetical protein [Trypanosoma congolense IL3000]
MISEFCISGCNYSPDPLGNGPGEAECHIRELLHSLLDGVRSEEALLRAARGPRVSWNPYRPARGERLKQGILDSEIFEWRTKVSGNSLHVVGNSMAIRTQLSPGEDNVASQQPPTAPVANFTKGLAGNAVGTESSAPSAVCRPPVLDNGDEETEFTISDSCVVAHNEETLQRVVDAAFNVLWQAVAVPWITEHHGSHSSRWAENETGVQHATPFARWITPNARRGKLAYPEICSQNRSQRGERSVYGSPQFKYSLPAQQPTLIAVQGRTPPRELPKLLTQRDTLLGRTDDSRCSFTQHDVHIKGKQRRLTSVEKINFSMHDEQRTSSCQRGVAYVKLGESRGRTEVEGASTNNGNTFCVKKPVSSRQGPTSKNCYPCDYSTSRKGFLSKLTEAVCGERGGNFENSPCTAEHKKLAPVHVCIKHPPQPGHLRSPGRL